MERIRGGHGGVQRGLHEGHGVQFHLEDTVTAIEEGRATLRSDASAETAPPKHLGRGESSRPAANNDNPVNALSVRCLKRLWLFDFLAHEDPAILLLDPPAGDRAQGRRAQGLATLEVEAGMMPRAADAAACHKSFGKRTAIVGTMGSDSENSGFALNKQSLFTARMT